MLSSTVLFIAASYSMLVGIWVIERSRLSAINSYLLTIGAVIH